MNGRVCDEDKRPWVNTGKNEILVFRRIRKVAEEVQDLPRYLMSPDESISLVIGEAVAEPAHALAVRQKVREQLAIG